MKQAVRVDEAQTLVLDCVQPGAVEKVALVDALHRVIAEDVTAPRDIPPHDNSAMDGYAVQHRDVDGATQEQPVSLHVLQVLPAGLNPEHTVCAGAAIKIMTGAPMPDGADTVVQVEHTNASDTQVDIYRAPRRGSNMRQRGEDIAAGDCIMARQTRLRPAELGVLASVGKPQVMVYQRPRVAILSTGDEIADLDDPALHSKIINSNSYTLAGQVLEAGGVPVLLGVARDTREEISERIASGLQADALITSGGVSAGDFDYVRDCLDDAGFETRFLTVAMRPGSPVTFGTVGTSAGVFPAGQSRRFDGDVRIVRAARLAENAGAHRSVPHPVAGDARRRRAQAPGGAHLFARRAAAAQAAGCDAHGHHYRSPGLGHFALDEPGELSDRYSRRGRTLATGRHGADFAALRSLVQTRQLTTANNTAQALSGNEFTQYRTGWGLRIKTSLKAHSNAM